LGQPNFSAPQIEKALEPIASTKISLCWRQRKGTEMSESLLDECHQSMLKIAETQPPDAKRAILIMAETFRVNSGPVSSVRAPDRQPALSRRLRSRKASRQAA
jgi:hypothetical protein